MAIPAELWVAMDGEEIAGGLLEAAGLFRGEPPLPDADLLARFTCRSRTYLLH
ncbi:MAG TPA: hypothetical protein VGH73_05335 [Thermoanaerobaculia bacterium]|jgi:hypothetical protein